MSQTKLKIKNKGFVLWFTGLSAAGKTTIADEVYTQLQSKNVLAERLDGDIIRRKLTKDLSYSKSDRNENIRRVGFVANLLSKNGIGVVASFITPYKEQRDMLRNEVQNYIEIFVDTPLEVCEQRDPKGMYKKAREGVIKSFTGIHDPYEIPANPNLHLVYDKKSPKDNAGVVIDFLKINKYID